MSRLATNDDNAPQTLAGLEGLEGWGKLKKKIGLNKLRTRAVVAKVAKVIPGAALIVPSKKAFQNAGKGLAVGGAAAATVLTGGKALAVLKPAYEAYKAKAVPGASAPEAVTEYQDANGTPITKEQYDALMAQPAPISEQMPSNVVPITAASGGGSASATSAAAEGPAAPAPKASVLPWALGAAVVAKLLFF